MSIEFDFAKRLHGAHGDLNLALQGKFAVGDLVALYGPSGAGKTTLLRLLAGLAAPDQGELVAWGIPWFSSAHRIARPTRQRDIALVFQDYALFPNMNVEENLRYAMRASSSHELERILALLQLTELRQRRPATLSGGQKQRVALGRALLRQAKLLLLDEPFAALDNEMRSRLHDELIAHQRRVGGITVLVSHDLAEVYKLATRVLILEQGKIVHSGPPQTVFGQSMGSGKFEFVGEVLNIQREDVLYAVTVLVGNQIVKVMSTPDEIAGLSAGSRVKLLAKAFNPILLKIA